MRDFIVLLIVLGMLPTAFRKPFTGLMLFSWLAYMRPQDLCWGFARDMRFSFYVGIVMLVGWFINERGRRKFANHDVRTICMVLLALLVSISFAFAKVHDKNTVTYFVEFIKIILIATFTTGLVDTKQRLRMILWLIALSLGFYGFKNGIMGVISGGSPIIRGPGGMLEDNNDFALALVMNIPLLFWLANSEKKRWVRRSTLMIAGLTVITIILTHSRGGFLALAGSTLWLAWRSGKLFQATMLFGVLAVMFLMFAPASVTDRLSTIADAAQGNEDSSVDARFRAWGIALEMVRDNPILGVGLRNFQSYRLSIDEHAATAHVIHVAHNSYLQIWAESGTPAFVIYLLLLSSVFFACNRMMRLSKRRPDLHWLGCYARGLEASTFGFMIGAMFLNRGHFDLIYHLFALVSCTVFIGTRAYLQAPGVTGFQSDEANNSGGQRITIRRRSGARRAGGSGTDGSGPNPRPSPVWSRAQMQRDSGFGPTGQGAR